MNLTVKSTKVGLHRVISQLTEKHGATKGDNCRQHKGPGWLLLQSCLKVASHEYPLSISVIHLCIIYLLFMAIK